MMTTADLPATMRPTGQHECGRDDCPLASSGAPAPAKVAVPSEG